MLAFPLTSYEETRPWSRAIEEEVLRRHMPPWRAVPGYGVFANDGGLTGRELQLIVAWIQGNGPKDSAQRIVVNVDQLRSSPAEHLRADTDRWELGRPDLLRTLPTSLVEASQPDQIRKVDVDLALESDRRVRALEFRPGDRRVLRAAFFSIRETGQWIGSWTPWYGTVSLPTNTSHLIRAGAHVEVELHYRGANVPVEDRGQLGLYFTRDTAARCTADSLLLSHDSPQQTPRGWRASARLVLPAETRVLALNPQLGPSADSLEVSARQPSGKSVTLLFVKDIMPEWPTPYILKDAVTLPPGTELSMVTYARESGSSPVGETSGPGVRLMVSYRDCEPSSLTSKVNGNVRSVSR